MFVTRRKYGSRYGFSVSKEHSAKRQGLMLAFAMLDVTLSSRYKTQCPTPGYGLCAASDRQFAIDIGRMPLDSADCNGKSVCNGLI